MIQFDVCNLLARHFSKSSRTNLCQISLINKSIVHKQRRVGKERSSQYYSRGPKVNLNPLDFFLWGYCKEINFKTLPEDADELDTRLRHAIWAIEEDIMEDVQRNLLKRMRACVRVHGGHFEHLL
ncbi:hypothetical protein P5V15_002898 [Pogonomyrmex californicus]